jgi:uncharacterized protein (DUF1501 family)
VALDQRFGLHPALAPVIPLWQAGRLAFVHACGSPDPTRSHLDAQDFMETATPGIRTTSSGWLNRLLAALPGMHGPLEAIAVGPLRRRILAGDQPVANVPLGPAAGRPMALDRPQVAEAFARLYDGNDDLARTFRQGLAERQDLMTDLAGEQADNGAPGPAGFPALAARLARLLVKDDRIRLAFADLGGWDTHVNEGGAKGQLANHLQPLGEGLAALANGLGARLDDTATLVMSEFGRTVRENGNGGTDHGHGNVLWLLGGAVEGGRVHGPWPGLADDRLYQGRDLAVSSDFRDVIAVVLARHMGLSGPALDEVLPGRPQATPTLTQLIRT